VRYWRTKELLLASSNFAMALAFLRRGSGTLDGGTVSFQFEKPVSKEEAIHWILGHPVLWRFDEAVLWHAPLKTLRGLADTIYHFDTPDNAVTWVRKFQEECDGGISALGPKPDNPIRPSVSDPRGLRHAKEPEDETTGEFAFKVYEND
jgi:hypothetical protein